MKNKILGLIMLALFATFLNANKAPKPFLITSSQLPHMTGIIMKLWDDKNLALTKKQKEKLLVVRIETITKAKALNKQIIPLEKSIIKATLAGKTADELKDNVHKLAKLRADATVIHIQCIYNTRKILTKKQLQTL